MIVISDKSLLLFKGFPTLAFKLKSLKVYKPQNGGEVTEVTV